MDPFERGEPVAETQRTPEYSGPIRREARSYEWEKLTSQQQVSAQRVGELLEGLLALPVDRENQVRSPLDEILPPLRKNHWNNVILIDGNRGSGKTTLLASILQALSARLRKDAGAAPEFFEEGMLPPERVVPIAFLDLHPLPASTHLLFHLVARFERVVRALEVSGSPPGEPDAPAWRSSAAKVLACRERWNAFAEVVSTTWHGNLAQRAPNLDTEFYAWELAKIETKRLGITETFRDFVDALCADFTASALQGQSWDKSKDPLFLIAVDDVDLVPNRSAEVLDLLRMLWHPRVVFLLTGDSDQLLTVLRNDFMGMLLRPLSNLQVAEERSVREDAASRSLLLARSTLDKIIPPAHRCKIESFSDEEKLGKVSKEFQALKIHTGKDPEGMHYYFRRDGYAAKALPSQYRSLEDLKAELGRLAKEKKMRPRARVAQAIAGLWQDLLQREPLLFGEERDALREVVRLDENGMLVIDGVVVECSFTGRRVREITQGNRSIALMRSQALRVSLRSKPRALPDSINGALKLATNLVADVDDFHFYGESPAPSGFDLEPVVIRWSAPDVPNLRSGFTWPLPDWQGFLSTTLFVDGWNKVVSTHQERPVDESEISFLARRFLTFVVELAEARRINEPPEALDWSSLAIRIEALAANGDARGSTERDRRIQSWALGRAGLLAAPEGGLPQRDANLWLAALTQRFNHSVGSSLQSSLLEERRNQIKKRWEGEPPDQSLVNAILLRIDRAHPRFHWVQKISKMAYVEEIASQA
jgi:hypothetical protein